MDYTNTDRRILAFLEYDGRATVGLLVDEHDYHRSHIYRRLNALEKRGEIKKRHDGTGLYELADG